MTQAVRRTLTPRERYGSPIIEIGRIASLASCMLLTQAALGQFIAPLDFIATTFGVAGDAGQESWGAAAYSLTVGTFVLPAGRAGDILGHRNLVMFGMLWFALWSIICGVSSYSGTIIFFDFCRAMQGLGPAIMLPNSVAIIARVYPPGTWRRLISFSIYAATAPGGFIIGATFASLLALNTPVGWPWGFYVMAIVLVLDAVIVFICVPSDKAMDEFDFTEVEPTPDEEKPQLQHKRSEPPSPDQSSVQHAHPRESADVHDDLSSTKAPAAHAKPKFDWLGTLFGMSGLILFNFVWSQAYVVGWSVVYEYVLLIVAVLLLVIFFVLQTKVSDPLVPTNIWTVQSSLMIGCIACGWSSFGILIFYFWRFKLVVEQKPILLTVAENSPAAVSGCIAAGASVFGLRKLGPGWVMLVSMLAFMTASILQATTPVGQTYWAQSFPLWIIAPFGMDMSFPSATIIVSETLPFHQQGLGSSLVNTVV